MTIDDDTQSYANDSATSSPARHVADTAGSADVPGWTYFIRVEDAIKIGSATSFKRRLHALQTAHEKPIEVLAVVPVALADEYKTHQLFAHLRIRGEWFQADRELLYFIEGLKEAAANLPEPTSPLSAEARAMVKRLIATRNAHGAETAMGHACSNLAEQIENLATYKRPEWASHECQTLPWMMERQMRRIEALKAQSN